MAIRPILKTCISIYLTILSGISGKIIMDEQVRPGYPTKADPTGSWYSHYVAVAIK
jgi:hypothetical protein